MFTHIAHNNEILSGKPYIVGTRLSIEFILELFASGATKQEILKTYPQLTAEAVEEALKYAAQSVKNEALARELGTVGMVCFLQQFDTGHGDYSKDRHNWLDEQDMDTVLKRIREKREANKKPK